MKTRSLGIILVNEDGDEMIFRPESEGWVFDVHGNEWWISEEELPDVLNKINAESAKQNEN